MFTCSNPPREKWNLEGKRKMANIVAVGKTKLTGKTVVIPDDIFAALGWTEDQDLVWETYRLSYGMALGFKPVVIEDGFRITTNLRMVLETGDMTAELAPNAPSLAPIEDRSVCVKCEGVLIVPWTPMTDLNILANGNPYLDLSPLHAEYIGQFISIICGERV
jgi:hypothetical protein